MSFTQADQFRFDTVLQPGDRISFGQACSEPVGLVRALLQQAPGLSAVSERLRLFVAGSYSGLIQPEHAACFEFAGYGAFGDAAALAKAGLLALYPVHYSRLPDLLANELKPDVVLLQVSRPDANGRYSLGAASDYQLATARRARVVIAEVNVHTPYLPNALLPLDVRIDHMVTSDEPLVEGPRSTADAVSDQVANHVAGLIPHEATLQMGIGNLMDAVCRQLRTHRNLGIHSGVLTDGMAELMKAGVVTNARKGAHVGKSVVGSLLGSRTLFDFADGNPDILLVETAETHGVASLAQQRRLCSVNSAVEVDLTGQVNAEVSGGRYIGAVGGQVDFVRAASCSEGGASIIALPSSARSGQLSRIVAELGGPVTTPRSDVDHVVTEWGVAHLRGLSLRQRAQALVGIAHPSHREALQLAASRI
ncbi:MAG: acetyl-CoA hydrolase/transferase C-terminal domain-containing protein [Hydrogenophaga sp.]|nr:acetyl-CoA hydrolase/transferase C-terminal domain-containing protein [Hydrogenophaga sp.]